GLKVEIDFPYYHNGFPPSILDKFIKLNNLPGFLGNKAASGTVIIEELGDEHVQSGKPIVYTSADSVFQIAAHEEVIPIERLYEICEISRNKIFINEHSVGRIIARPFVGKSGSYKRTTNRKDFSIPPPKKTILDFLHEESINTIAIGKINDLFNYRGINKQVKTKSNSEGIEKIIHYSAESKNSFIFANLVDFDVYFGHRNDPDGFHNALIEFDNRLPEIIDALDESDVLAITADHGNDPTTISTDHSREYVPIFLYRKNRAGKNLGTCETFSDLAQTIAHFYKVNNDLKGKSFLDGR
ncbi:MAG: phosphopentomutase, partial [Melioribacteraceae bacterium]|nr:phosphopentomutase [Melioribacteraceae bacterium]